MNETMQTAIDALLTAISTDYLMTQRQGEARTEVDARMFEEFHNGLHVSVGRDYVKIMTSRSVWGFVNLNNPRFRVGDILLAAGYNRPALNKARGNVFDPYTIRWTGPGYLR